MNLKRQKSSIANREFTGGKKDTNYFTKKLKEFGLKVPKYLSNGITQKQFKTLQNKLLKSISNRQHEEQIYNQQTKKLNRAIKQQIKLFNERVDIVSSIVRKKYDFTVKDWNYITGKPITYMGRNKTFDNYNDNLILAHKSFKRLHFSDNDARKEHLQYMKELTKGMTVKNFENWFIENKGATDWFENEYLKGQLFDELSEKDIDTLMDYFNSLSGLKKELVIKQALNKIKEKYENSEDPTAYKFKAYNQVMNNLINYGKNDEVS